MGFGEFDGNLFSIKAIKIHQRPSKVIKQGIAISASAVDVQVCHKTSEALP